MSSKGGWKRMRYVRYSRYRGNETGREPESERWRGWGGGGWEWVGSGEWGVGSRE